MTTKKSPKKKTAKKSYETDRGIRVCRDEDCPECGWPETYAEVDILTGTPCVLALGCSKCGWKVEV